MTMLDRARTAPTIPLLRPRLPEAAALAPWLAELDRSGVYSNNGPLCRRFGDALAALHGLPGRAVVPVANGTTGLVAALLGQGVTPGTLCMVPSWTFAATAHAARAAGLVPWLVDVDPRCGSLTPALAKAWLERAPGPVTACMPVVPFGIPFPYQAWEGFQRETGLTVVIDAAAAFDTLRPCAVATVVSLHATKIFGIGEGGFVACSQPETIRKVARAVNFGFEDGRDAMAPAVNGKLSEIQAAVGLAGLAEWKAHRAAYAMLCRALASALGEVPGLALLPGWGEDWVSNTCLVRTPGGIAPVERVLGAAGIETRRWWSDGLHAQPAFAACPRTAMPATEWLAGHVLGLPCHLDLTGTDIARIAETAFGSYRHPSALSRSIQVATWDM